MQKRITASIAVSAATFPIDRPYDYLVPENMTVYSGTRVIVPFGCGSRRTEGVVLAVRSELPDRPLKAIESVIDDTPIITEEQLKLALWLHDRIFCTVYDVIRAMLPSGVWLTDGKKKIGDKTVNVARLCISAEEALQIAKQKRPRAPQQAQLIDLLVQVGQVSVKELMYFTGAAYSSVKALEKNELITIQPHEVYRRPGVYEENDIRPIRLNSEQETAYNELAEALDGCTATAHLLYGVTGSGKTLVYIKLIEKATASGKGVLMLVPEIALTPRLMSVFKSYFGDTVAVIHSALSIGERYDEWKRIRFGKAKIVIGTRSAVFAPVEKLGLIILDEEQEASYKSESTPRYNARDVAKYRCAHENALLLFGSATPSLESMYAAARGKFALHRIEKRYNSQSLPQVITADMRDELRRGNQGIISKRLAGEIQKNLDCSEQTILFINRRGASTLLTCSDCGEVQTCPRCSVALTYHSANGRLMCHYCGYSALAPKLCPACAGKIRFTGAGTQKAEQELRALFPSTEIIRMDSDTVTAKNSHEELLRRFKNENVPILLGTQMVAKGLDYPNVTLVGVLSADQSLYANDYMAAERTFSMLTQVIGRCGRGEKKGRAVIQTYTPENEVLLLAAAQDYDTFYEREIEMRIARGFPPACILYAITVSGENESSVLKGAVKIRQSLLGYLNETAGITILGPAPACVLKINNRFRYRISLYCDNTKKVRDTIAHVIRESSHDKQLRGITVFADLDPYDF